jgi:hypothetical protein
MNSDIKEKSMEKNNLSQNTSNPSVKKDRA